MGKGGPIATDFVIHDTSRVIIQWNWPTVIAAGAVLLVVAFGLVWMFSGKRHDD